MSVDVFETPQPADEAAERVVIGAAMVNPRVLEDVALVPGDFFLPAHALVWQVMSDLHGQAKPTDPVSLAAALIERGEISRVGGAPYLHTLYAAGGVVASAGHYAGIVTDRAVRRRLIQAGTRIVQFGLSSDGSDLGAITERARAEVDAATQGRDTTGPDGDLDDLMADGMGRWETGMVKTLPTGWRDVDAYMTGGLRPGHLCLIGGRPSVGKSLAGSSLALQAARQGMSVLVASLEMSKEELFDRIMANAAGVKVENLIRHRLTDDDWSRVGHAAPEMSALALRVDDRGRQTVNSIRGAARDLTRTSRGLDMVIVDYVQQMTPVNSSASREQQVAGFSRGLKMLARELNVPVVALAQIGRGPESRQDKRPQMSDLRESGALEADADEIILLHRDDKDSPGEIEFNVVKNRHGKTGRLPLVWQPVYSRITDLWRGK